MLDYAQESTMSKYIFLLQEAENGENYKLTFFDFDNVHVVSDYKASKPLNTFSESSKGPFTKDVRLNPGEGGLQNPDVQLFFECDSTVLSGRRGRRI